MGNVVSGINSGSVGLNQTATSYPLQKNKEALPPMPAKGQESKTMEKEISPEHIKSVINKAYGNIKFTETKFIYYRDINRIAIKVIDKETQEVIREIPPEETIEILQNMMESAGLLIDVKR